jgi:hypothetical protein
MYSVGSRSQKCSNKASRSERIARPSSVTYRKSDWYSYDGFHVVVSGEAVDVVLSIVASEKALLYFEHSKRQHGL